jgi:predicted short-subunit dehydrogenase-like oxidoreductase (DUF2520 family)
MKIVLIGSGNVATIFGRKLIQSTHEVVQVLSKEIEHAKILANELNCAHGDLFHTGLAEADLYLVCLTDNALYEINKLHFPPNKIVVHTAGSVSKETLNTVTDKYGVIYPLQSLNKNMNTTVDMPLLIDGNSEETIAIIEDLATAISSTTKVVGDEERLKLHLSAVFVNNFTNHIYSLIEDYCQKESLDFDLLKPLIQETTNKIMTASPKDVQTGPALRKDITTLDKHLRLLATNHKLKTTYLKITDSIMNP